MIEYIEQFDIGDDTYGVEELPKSRQKRVKKRGLWSSGHKFLCWKNGCGIGYADTIEDCRNVIYNHAKYCLTDSIKRHMAHISIEKKLLEQLGKDSFSLGRFKTK